MLGFGAIGEFAIGELATNVATAEFIGPDKYMQAFSLPVRFKSGLSSPNQQFLFLQPSPVVSFSWFKDLSLPVRQPPRSPAAIYPNFFWQPAPSPFVATGWYNWLSEPVRYKIGLKAYLHPFETQNPEFIPEPPTLLEGWFNWLSDPVRLPVGLKVQYQKPYFSPDRLLPNPNITATINALEINNDKVSIIVNVIKSNPVVSAKVSIVEIGTGLSFTSIIESS